MLRGVDFSTGSLGHGLSLGAGAALAARHPGLRRAGVYVLMSDAECNEGSVWEASMFAAHHRLANLVAMIDLNGQQALGYTQDVLDLGAARRALAAPSAGTSHEVDGHDPEALAAALDGLDTAARARRTCSSPHTTFGKGVSFMESQIEWHYLPMSTTSTRSRDRELDARAAA